MKLKTPSEYRVILRHKATGLLLPVQIPAALAALVVMQLAAGMTNAVEASVLDYIVNDGAAPTQFTYIGMSTTTPTETGSNFTEPSGNNYSRLSTAAADWAAATGADPSTKANGVALSMAKASGSWGTLTHWGLFAASSGGTVGIWAALSTSKAIGADDTPNFAVGDLVMKLGDPTDTY